MDIEYISDIQNRNSFHLNPLKGASEEADNVLLFSAMISIIHWGPKHCK